MLKSMKAEAVPVYRAALSSWMYKFSGTCPDPALKAFQTLDESDVALPRIAIWVGVLVAAEQAIHAFTLAVSARRPVHFTRMRIKPFRLPIGLALTWVVFTALSVVLVALTFRSNAAILAKSMHVAAEAGFLILLSTAFGLHLFAATVACLVLVVIMFVFTMNCEDSVMFAATSGLLLDATNFFVYACFGFSMPKDDTLWTLVAGLGWHAMYLVTQLEVMRWSFLEPVAKLWFRIAGLYFNLVASEFFLAACRRALMDTCSGNVNLREWASRRPDDDLEPYCIWTRHGVRLIGQVPENVDCRVNGFEPHRTAYTRAAIYYALNALCPLCATIRYHRKSDTTTVRCAIGCGFGWVRPVDVVGINHIPATHAYVLSWQQVRLTYWCALIAIGCIVGQYR